MIHVLELLFLSAISILHIIVVFQDIGILNPFALSRELLPMIAVLILLVFAILFSIEANFHKEIISRESTDLELFE